MIPALTDTTDRAASNGAAVNKANAKATTGKSTGPRTVALAQAQAFHHQSHTLANISIYEQRLARLFDRTLKQLREIQAERRELEAGQMIDAAQILQMHEEREVPYDPAQDGFVFSTAEIETFIWRRDRIDEAYDVPERQWSRSPACQNEAFGEFSAAS